MAVSEGGSGSNEAFSLVAGNSAHIVSLLKTASDLADEKEVTGKAEEIIRLPPEEKFTEAVELFGTAFGLETDLAEAELEDLPPWLGSFIDEENIEEFLSQGLDIIIGEIRGIRNQVQESILNRSSGEQGYLILLELLLEIEELLEYISNNVKSELDEVADKKALLSTYCVLVSHFLLISTRERQEVYPELIRDIYRYRFYFAHARGEDVSFDFEEKNLDEMKNRVLILAATDLYRLEEITVSRGAELVGLRRDAFERLLVKRGIRPEYGPGSVDELHDDVDL